MPATLHIPIKTLQWAAHSAGLNLEDVAAQIAKRDYEKVVKGELSVAQIREFAKITEKPFGFLFMDAPPEDNQTPDIPDMRRRKNSAPLSKNFIATYEDILYKQSWYKDYLLEQGADELEFIGKYGLKDDASSIAKDICQTLRLDDDEAIKARKKDDYYDFLSRRAEEARILIFRNGVVKNKTRSPLNFEEFQGFVITDKIAPAIFLNAADKTAVKTFTLVHELAHLWLGKSAVSDSAKEQHNATEEKCDAIAAEVLVPSAEFLLIWKKLGENSEERIQKASAQFGVSMLVVARVARELRLITEEEYWSRHKIAQNKASEKKGDGGNFEAMSKVRNSRQFSKTIDNLLRVGKVDFREASLLLNRSMMGVKK